MQPSVPEKLGVIAGGGDLPRQLLDGCRQKGMTVGLACIRDFADPDLFKDEDGLWFRLGEVGKAISYFKEKKIFDVVMIGPVKRPSLGQLRPDWWTAKFLAKIGFKAFGDDNLLTLIIKGLEKEGFHIHGIHEFLPDILAPQGVFGKIKPDEQALADIAHGLKIARGLGALDVGQSVVVQQGIVLAVEAVEGTDAMIKRCGALKRDGVGGVLIKTKKPQQERRADLPTIGMTTLMNAAESGLRGIAVQAGHTLVVDKAGLTKKADELGLFITGVNLDEDEDRK